MSWRKMGRIFAPAGERPWAAHSALQPTPLLLEAENRIRLYLGMRDEAGVSRVGWIEVDADDPSRVLDVATTPALDVGAPGCFDDNGVVPCAVVRRDDGIYLYYAGYLLPRQVRFHVFGGLAVSRDGGRHFERVQHTPVVDRTEDELLFRVIHSVRWNGAAWQAWYGGGSTFEAPDADGHTRAVYNIRYMESPDGIHFPDRGEVSIDVAADEHRVGRPFVLHDPARGYEMWFAGATRAENYRLRYARSEDGRRWRMATDDLGLACSPEGWDSEMMSYPAVVRRGGRAYLFYNGNGYGRTGVGWALREEG